MLFSTLSAPEFLPEMLSSSAFRRRCSNGAYRSATGRSLEFSRPWPSGFDVGHADFVEHIANGPAAKTSLRESWPRDFQYGSGRDLVPGGPRR